MQIETLGDAWNNGVTVWIACAGRDPKPGLKRGRYCEFKSHLDMMTLVCTRGRDFPMARLAERLKCPRCGCREIRVMWDFPSQGKPSAGAVIGI